MEQTPTLADVMQESKPTRRRGRPSKEVPTDVFGNEPETKPEPKPRTRRSKSVTSDHVVQMVQQGFGLVAMITRKEYWNVAPSEVEPWAKSAAELLNSIPDKYIKSAVNMSGYVMVSVGLYGIVQPRLEYEAKLKAQENLETAVQNGTMTPEDAQSAFETMYSGVGS